MLLVTDRDGLPLVDSHPSKQGRLHHINDGANAPWKK